MVSFGKNKNGSPRVKDINRERWVSKTKIFAGAVATAANTIGAGVSAWGHSVVSRGVGSIEGAWETTDAYAKIKDASGTVIESSLDTINDVLPYQTLPAAILGSMALGSLIFTVAEGYKHRALTRERAELSTHIAPVSTPQPAPTSGLRS